MLIFFSYGQKDIHVSQIDEFLFMCSRLNIFSHLYLPLATEAVHFQNTKGVARNMGAPLELIASDVLDHYRTYSLLERLLYTPTKLSEQPSFQLEPQSQQLLIEK